MGTQIVYINLSASEAIAASKGELRTLVRPLKEQPPSVETLLHIHSKVGKQHDVEFHFNSKLQFPKDCEIWGREMWCYDYLYYGFMYKASYPNFTNHWRSPVTMPPDAIRFKRVSKGSRVCLASCLAMEEWIDAGWTLADTWAVRYPKLDFYKAWVEVPELEAI